MTVRAQIISSDDLQPLASANAVVVNASGQYLGQGVKADSTGKFALTSDILVGNYLLISYAGMEPVMIAADLLTGTNYKVVKLYTTLLDTVVVTPKRGWPWWAWPAILVAGVAAVKIKRGTHYAR